MIFGSGIYLDKLDLNISLRLLDYYSVFQAEVMAIYRAAQWILFNDALFTCVSIFIDSQAAVKYLRPLGKVAVALIFFLGTSSVYHWCRFTGTTIFREIAGQTN